MPVEKLQGGNWPHPARLPLGCGWSGHCTAPGHDGEIPPQHILEALCNLGYAGSCTWAPSSRDWDAVRFAVTAPGGAISEKSQSNVLAAPVLRLSFVCERNHRPIAKGELMFDLAGATWLSRHDDPRVQKMAECFLETYLKRKS